MQLSKVFNEKMIKFYEKFKLNDFRDILVVTDSFIPCKDRSNFEFINETITITIVLDIDIIYVRLYIFNKETRRKYLLPVYKIEYNENIINNWLIIREQIILKINNLEYVNIKDYF